MQIQRRFILGDEWLYIKLYSGPKLLEELLTNEIFEVAQKLYERDIIKKFFFLRFYDDSHHLRLRFLVKEIRSLGEVISLLREKFEPYIANRLVWKLTADTYNRELERYGSLSIEDVETIFSVDSWGIINVLRDSARKGTSDGDWLWGIMMMDKILDQFELTISEKHGIYRSYSQMFAKEFGENKVVRDAIQKKYRGESKLIEKALTAQMELPNLGLTERQHHDLKAAVSNLKALRDHSLLEVPLDQLLKSLMHMHYNRLFRTNQRFHEYLISTFMDNYYRSLQARVKKANMIISKV